MSSHSSVHSTWRGRAAVVGAGVVALASLGVAATASAQVASSAVVKVQPMKKAVLETEKTPLGTILVDKKGRTVYVFMADARGVSNCAGQCLKFWPPVVAPAKMPASVPGVTGKLGVLTRTDGTRQLTINGWPLYLYAGDTKPGMTAGQGSNGGGALWWVVGPNGKKITKKVASTTATPAASPRPSASGSASSSSSASSSASTSSASGSASASASDSSTSSASASTETETETHSASASSSKSHS